MSDSESLSICFYITRGGDVCGDIHATRTEAEAEFARLMAGGRRNMVYAAVVERDSGVPCRAWVLHRPNEFWAAGGHDRGAYEGMHGL